MGNHARGKGQAHFLRRDVNRAEEAPAGKARAARLGIDTHLSQEGEINHHAAVAGAKPRETVTSTADRGDYAGGGGGADGSLDIELIGATGDQAGLASNHAIPDRVSQGVGGVGGAQEIALELGAQRRMEVIDGCGHTASGVH